MKHLHPRAVWLFFMSSFFPLLVLFVFLSTQIWAIFFQASETEEIGGVAGWFLIFLLFFFALVFGWAKLSYKYYKYELVADGFRKESGVIQKKYVTIPYDKIQNVDIHRGILARLLGLSDLKIQTAGASAAVSRYGIAGGGAEGKLPGILHEDAEKLRDELVQRAKQFKPQAPQVAVPPQTPTPPPATQ